MSRKDHSGLLASEAHRRQSMDEWKQLLARYPLTSGWALGFNILAALGANAVTVWLVITGRMTPFEVVVLVALEAALLIGVALAQSRFVPPEARETQPMGWRERLGTAAFGLVWLAGVYGLVLFAFVPSGDEIARAVQDPIAFLAGSNLRWPLLITLIVAAIDTLGDVAHFRRHGGTFISTSGFNGAARLLTLFLGGIPFAVPFFGAVLALKLIADRIGALLERRAGKADERALIALVVFLPLAGWGLFNGVEWIGTTLESGVDGAGLWVLCYCAAKFVADLFVVCLPLIASKAHAEDAQALAKLTAAPPKRRSRLP